MPDSIASFLLNGFVFNHADDGTIEVSHNGRVLGQIKSYAESSGRQCFVLCEDDIHNPIPYQDQFAAAKALQALNHTVRMAENERWVLRDVVLNSWKRKPDFEG